MNRDWNPFEEAAAPPESVRVFGIELRVGDRVRITPKKKADILDMALAGKIAVIEAIEQDFEDRVQLALVLDVEAGVRGHEYAVPGPALDLLLQGFDRRVEGVDPLGQLQ